jgi:chromosome segregation ATPase
VAENTLRRFARLLAGVVLTQGHLGHEVLGQLLIFDATEVEVAGANLAIAATNRQRSAIAQVAIRTAVPALAVQALLSKREKQLEARERRLITRVERVLEADPTLQTERQRMRASRSELAGKSEGVRARRARLDACYLDLRSSLATLQSSRADAVAKLDALEDENRTLRKALDDLRAASTRSPDEPHEPSPTPPLPGGRRS